MAGRRASCLRGWALLALWPALAGAAEVAAQDQPQVVSVQAPREVDEMPYRRFFEGMQVFAANRQLAPAAELRFRLYPRAAGASLDGLALSLVSGKTEIPVPLDADHAFRLPMDPALARADAVLMSNRKAGSIAWRVDIRTPGLPPNTRRLGDLRLECRVDMKGAELRRMLRTPEIRALAAFGDPCTHRGFENPFFAERPVFNVILVHGGRREAIAGDWMYANTARMLPEAMYALTDWRYARDRLYLAPLADADWPDDTLLEFEYMDGPPQPSSEVRP